MQTKIHQTANKNQLTHSAMKSLSPLQNPFFPYTLNNPNAPKNPPHPPGNSPTERYGDDLEVSDLGDCCGRAPELMGLNSYEILLEIEN